MTPFPDLEKRYTASEFWAECNKLAIYHTVGVKDGSYLSARCKKYPSCTWKVSATNHEEAGRLYRITTARLKHRSSCPGNVQKKCSVPMGVRSRSQEVAALLKKRLPVSIDAFHYAKILSEAGIDDEEELKELAADELQQIMRQSEGQGTFSDVVVLHQLTKELDSTFDMSSMNPLPRSFDKVLEALDFAYLAGVLKDSKVTTREALLELDEEAIDELDGLTLAQQVMLARRLDQLKRRLAM